jgi:ankyrin repeat protein
MLHYAANSGNVELVDMLLDYAANPNVQSTGVYHSHSHSLMPTRGTPDPLY